MLANPTPSSPPEEKSTSHGLSLGALLFGAIFILVAGLIFTIILGRPTGFAKTPVTKSNIPKLPLTYPPTRTVVASDTYFGVKVDDPYRWLEDDKSPEVLKWREAQNKLAHNYLDAMPGRVALARRYSQLMRIDTVSAPGREGDRYFYSKRKADQEKSVLFWRDATTPDSEEHVLFDPNPFIGTTNVALGAASVSYDGKLLAYTLRPNNADESTLYVRSVDTGKDLPNEVIEGAKYADPSWLPDNSGFVYTFLPPADPAHPEDRPGLAEVRFHKLGTDPKNDPVIHEKSGVAGLFAGAYVSRDGKWIFYDVGNWAKNDIYYQPLNGEPTAALLHTWKPLIVDQPFLYSLTPWHGDAYIRTNENASNYRLFKVSLDDPSRAKWKEIIPQSPTAVLQGAGIVGNRLVVDWLENVTTKIEIRDLDGKLIRPLDLPGLGTAGAGGDPDHDELFYEFVSFIQPLQIFKTSVNDPATKLWAELNVPIDPSKFEVEQKFFSSKDGTQVPMFIVHKKGLLRNGETPFLLNGYGGFGVNETPAFSSGIYCWLEAGGGYALVNLRGGGEFGEKWHQDGMLTKKQNVFDDCIGAAQYLIANGYTNPNRLALRGGSNGGLLVGAVLVQRPDLFRSMVCEVPLLDMLRYDKFRSGKTWVPEYGSPANEEQFKALYAYSPLQNIKPGTKYPSVLFCSSADDDRVDPMHAQKMAAALQKDTGSKRPILLRVESHAGHGGGDQIQKTIDMGTDIWCFLIHELGAIPPK